MSSRASCSVRALDVCSHVSCYAWALVQAVHVLSCILLRDKAIDFAGRSLCNAFGKNNNNNELTTLVLARCCHNLLVRQLGTWGALGVWVERLHLGTSTLFLGTTGKGNNQLSKIGKGYMKTVRYVGSPRFAPMAKSKLWTHVENICHTHLSALRAIGT